jgi:hypothetical protein
MASTIALIPPNTDNRGRIENWLIPLLASTADQKFVPGSGGSWKQKSGVMD